MSSNEYLVWLVHLPDSEKVKTLLKSPVYILFSLYDGECTEYSVQGARGYEYQEWRLFQNLMRVAQLSLLENAEGKEVEAQISHF